MEESESAGFWIRGGALFVDFIVTGLAGGLLSVGLYKLHGPLIPRMLILVAASMAYRIGMIGRWGQTVGKMAAGIVVVAADGSPIGYGRAAARHLANYLSAAPMDAGFLIAAWTDKKRALHDFVAGTRVIYKPDAGPRRRTAMTALGVFYPVAMVCVSAYIGWRIFLPIAGGSMAARFEKEGKYDQAEGQFDSMIRLFPKNPVWWNGRCWERAIIGTNLDGALADCDQSLALGRMGETLDSRGLVLLKMKRYDEAVAQYDEALKAMPDHASSLYGRSLARKARGDDAGAAADFAAAMRRDPAIAQTFRKYVAPPADR